MMQISLELDIIPGYVVGVWSAGARGVPLLLEISSL